MQQFAVPIDTRNAIQRIILWRRQTEPDAIGRLALCFSISDDIGVIIFFLSQLENGQGNISISRLAGVAEALGVPLTSLIDDSRVAASEAQQAAAWQSSGRTAR